MKKSDSIPTAKIKATLDNPEEQGGFCYDPFKVNRSVRSKSITLANEPTNQ